MPRGNRIKWRKADTQKVANVARQFNAKLTRTLKAHPEWADYLPDRVSTKDIRANSPTRQDLNRQLNSLQRFLRPKAELPVTTEGGVQTTRWQLKETSIKLGVVNRKRTIERIRADVSTEKGTMGTIAARNLDPKRLNYRSISPEAWKKFQASLEHQIRSNYTQEQMVLYKENYLKALRTIYSDDNKWNLRFGEAGRALYDYVATKVDPETLYRAYYNDPRLQLEFIYDPQEAEEIAEWALETWKGIMGDTE